MANHAYEPVEQPRNGHGRAVTSPQGREGGGRHAGGRPPKRRRNGWDIVFWVALVVFVLAVAALGVIALSYWQGQKAYDELAAEALDVPDDAAADEVALDELTVDWEALAAINEDIVGWIYIPGSVVNYPIVQGDDDSYYLKHGFTGESGWAGRFGTIFLAAANSGDFSDDNNLLYGHHMANGSMFGLIGDMIKQSTFDEYRTIYILTPEGNYKLRTFALVDVASTDTAVVVDEFDSAEEQAAYYQDKIDDSIVDASDIVDVSEMEKTFMLCTCDELASDGRYLLYAYVEESTVTDEDVGAAVDEAVEETVS